MSLRLAPLLCVLAALAPAAGRAAATTFTPPPTPYASTPAAKTVLAAVPPPAAGEIVVDFEKAEIGQPMPNWEEKGVKFRLYGPLQRTPAAQPRVMFFPHIATDHKGILNAMSTDQSVPLEMALPGAGASSVTLVLWGSTGCPVLVEAYDKDGKLVDQKSVASVPGRKAPEDAVPFLTVTLKAPAITTVYLSGPRNGEILAADEVRFVPLPAAAPVSASK
ncbi:MAG: hypothetical protein WCL04_03890 [Verrucomicrobiota bacterium]